MQMPMRPSRVIGRAGHRKHPENVKASGGENYADYWEKTIWKVNRDDLLPICFDELIRAKKDLLHTFFSVLIQ
jgi:hypothetical protein